MFLNDGSGGFGTSFVVDAPYGPPDAMAVADFNKDGNLDLVLAVSDLLFVLPGDGTGHFGQPYQSGEICGYQGFIDLAVADFNHDGKPDVFAKHGCDVTIYLGDGFTMTPHSIGIGEALVGNNWLAVADFNRDGNLDVLLGDGGDTLFGDGTGNFSSINNGNGAIAGPFAVEDFNGDGKIDVATTTINVHLGDGTGGFGPGVHYDDGLENQGNVEAADINGDGKFDLVTIGDGKVPVLLGNGDGTFGSFTNFPGAGTSDAQRMVIGDFNGDGKPDIAGVGGDKILDPYGASNPRLTVWLNSTYQTGVGTNSTVVVNNTTFTFDDVTGGGTTSVTPIDPASIGQVPGGFAVSNSVAYEVATTATFTGSVTLAFKVPGPISVNDFNSLAILHNVNGTLVDATASTPVRDYANLTIYATTTSFSPFYLARRGPHIKTLFDQTKAYKSGSTVPIKLQVLSGSNTNLSSSSTALVTRDLRLMNGNTSAPVVDSGNANPDYTFRYDSTLGATGGGYIFNLSTKGLSAGQYLLSFYVGTDRSFFYTVKFEVK